MKIELSAAEREALGFQTPGSGGLLAERIEAILTARLEQAEDARDEQERMAMQVRASADEWWGKWERENARAEKAEAALTDLRAKVRREFKACFVPDFGGYDWRDDATIQQLARTLAALVRDAP